MIAKSSHQMALYAKKLGNLDEALSHIDKSIGYKRMHREIIGMGKSYYLKALIQKELENFNDSIRCFQMGLSIFTKMDMKDDVEFGEKHLHSLTGSDDDLDELSELEEIEKIK
jgi:tetratricopeptide (TPR) repeat protein